MGADQICFNRQTFQGYILFGLGIIVFVIYRLYNSTETSSNINITDSLTSVIRSLLMEKEELLQANLNQKHDDLQRMFNPMVPPLHRGYYTYTGSQPRTLVHIPTRGEYGPFQQMGLLYSAGNPNHTMPIMGRRIHSNQFEYYTFHHKNPSLKIPITVQNKKEIDDGSTLQLTPYPDQDFTVKMYDIDQPRYIPY